MTTVINTHDMNSVLEIGDNVLLLKNGVKAWEGSSAEILATDDESVVSYVFRSNLFKKVRQAFRDMA
jgi:phospholipid/cholesterol/gamma-HCH transport system ATP-binding protein